MTPPPQVFHALLRPTILQILRASGYQAARPAVIDSLTGLAGRYLLVLCEVTAQYAGCNGDGITSTIVDVRRALDYVGAIRPHDDLFRDPALDEGLEQEAGLDVGAVVSVPSMEDKSGVKEFTTWFAGPQNAEIMRIALDGVEEATDYLTALKKKHAKNGQDSKYLGTLLGKGNEHGEVLVEGGEDDTIQTWIQKRRAESEISESKPPEADSRPPSSGLSSLDGRDIGEEMDLS